jgi:hypothetical protein
MSRDSEAAKDLVADLEKLREPRPLIGGAAAGGLAAGSVILGAAALGALALGALAIGVLAIGRLSIGKARFREIEIDNLIVRRRSDF